MGHRACSLVEYHQVDTILSGIHTSMLLASPIRLTYPLAATTAAHFCGGKEFFLLVSRCTTLLVKQATTRHRRSRPKNELGRIYRTKALLLSIQRLVCGFTTQNSTTLPPSFHGSQRQAHRVRYKRVGRMSQILTPNYNTHPLNKSCRFPHRQFRPSSQGVS